MSKTALVVDDSKSARFALRKFLESFNYKVDTAESASDAYRQLAVALPDVIFLDHIMPGVDGFEALRALKAEPRTFGVPVVICSSNEGEDFISQARARGASDVLQKPPSAEQIAGVLANLVSRPVDYTATLPPMPQVSEHPLATTLAPLHMPRREPTAMERLMATIPPKMIPTAHLLAPPAAAPAAAPAPPPAMTPEALAAFSRTLPALAEAPATKVQPLREPAVTIQQAVMKSLRSALPPPVENRAPAVNAPGLSPMTSLGGENDSPSLASLQEEMNTRFGRMTQDLSGELAALRAQLAALAGTAASEEKMRAIAQETAKARTHALAQSLEQHLGALRNNLDSVLRAQNDRIEQLSQGVRQAAAEEAERIVMNAAQRIGDQMAESLLKNLGPQLGAVPRSA